MASVPCQFPSPRYAARFFTAVGALGFAAGVLAGCARRAPSITAGRELYEANGCTGCHGLTGHGDGPIARVLASRPIDFRDISAFKRGASEIAIAETLVEDAAMPRFDHLTETERRSIALYVISMRAK